MTFSTEKRARHSSWAFSIPWVCTSTSPSSSSTCSSSPSSCSRRQFLNFSASTLLCLPSLMTARVAQADEAAQQEKLRSFDSVQQIEGVASKSVSFETFVGDIEAKSIKQVFFFGNQNQTCFYERPDGSVLRVTDGFPVEDPRSSQSPFWVMAKIRDLNIPFSVHPIPMSYLRRPGGEGTGGG